MNKELNACGLIAMILSLIGLLVFGIPCGLAAVILGILGLITAGENKGKGMAITGIVIGAFDAIAVTWFLSIVQVVMV